MVRAYETYLKVEGWNSEFHSVQNLLNHLKRKTKSEKSRSNYLQGLYYFSKAQNSTNPDKLVSLSKPKLEGLVQKFIDDMNEKDRSIRYLNVTLEQLKTFFESNGFKNGKSLEIERYHQPARYRKTEEYIPTKEEIDLMLNAAVNQKWKAIILGLYTSGLRNSTFRAVLYKDVKKELEDPKYSTVCVPVYPEMKKVVPEACKNNIPYITFFARPAVEAIRNYISDYKARYHFNEFPDNAPLFAARGRVGKPIKRRTLQVIVKTTARMAGLKEWKNVYPHCLRKTFDNVIKNSSMAVEDKEFLTGHILPGSQDTYFDKTKIEEFRGKYSKIEFLPEKLVSESRVRRKVKIDDMREEYRKGAISEKEFQKIESILSNENNDVEEAIDEAVKEYNNSLRVNFAISDRESGKQIETKQIELDVMKKLSPQEASEFLIKELNGKSVQSDSEAKESIQITSGDLNFQVPPAYISVVREFGAKIIRGLDNGNIEVSIPLKRSDFKGGENSVITKLRTRLEALNIEKDS